MFEGSGSSNKEDAAFFSSELVVTKWRGHTEDDSTAERFIVVSSDLIGF